MTKSDAAELKPLWLSIEENILKFDSQVLSGETPEGAIQQLAGELDSAGYNVSRHGSNLLKLRSAVENARKSGRTFMKDFNAAIGALTLEDVTDPFATSNKIVDKLGKSWPDLDSAERRPVVVQFVEQTKLDLLIAKAKDMPDDTGIRMLLEEKVESEEIIAGLEITPEKLDEVKEIIKQELAERARVAGLLEKVADKSKEEQVKHLFENDVTEALAMEMAEVDQGVVDTVKKAMEEEIKEKQRLAEEEAARKKKEAEGPSLDDISSDDMVYYIESIREIMEFSEVEKEIRVMCEQSSIPKALVDIAVTDPDKLDELESKAQG